MIIYFRVRKILYKIRYDVEYTENNIIEKQIIKSSTKNDEKKNYEKAVRMYKTSIR